MDALAHACSPPSASERRHAGNVAGGRARIAQLLDMFERERREERAAASRPGGIARAASAKRAPDGTFLPSPTGPFPPSTNGTPATR